MGMPRVLVVLLLLGLCSAEVLLLLDDFLAPSEAFLEAPEDFVMPFETETYVADEGIVGGAREMVLRATMGHEGDTVSARVGDGAWRVETTATMNALTFLQYDGDNGEYPILEPDVHGLNIDITVGGQANAFEVVYQSNVASTLAVYIYSQSGAMAIGVLMLKPSEEPQTGYIPFSVFPISANLHNIGAMEWNLEVSNEASVTIFSIGCGLEEVADGASCDRALPLRFGGNGNYITEGLVYANMCGLEVNSPTFWFKLDSEADGRLNLSTCSLSTTFDTVLAVVDSCDTLRCVAANDDFYCGGDTSSASTVQLQVAAGSTYYIMVAGYKENYGQFMLVASEVLYSNY